MKELTFIVSFISLLPLILSLSSGSEASSPKCEVVRLQTKAVSRDGGQRFLLDGFGSVVAVKSQNHLWSREELFILTPFHLVDVGHNLDRSIELRCGSQIVSAELVGHSATLDLALLRPKTARILKPLIYFDGQVTSGIFDPSVQAVQGQFQIVADPIIPSTQPFMVAIEVASSQYSPLLGYQKALLIRSFGAKPGLSGAPLLYRYVRGKTHFLLAGILVKTKLNANESVAIPASEIGKYLPLLMQGQDPWRVMNPNAPFLETSFELRAADRTIIKEFNIILDAGGSPIKLKDSGARSAFHEVSQWKSVGGDHTDIGGDHTDIGGDHTDIGGDHTDIGGDHTDIDGNTGRPLGSRFDTYSGIPNRPGTYSAVLRRDQSDFSIQDGLVFPDGRRLIGISDPKMGVIRIDGIEDLFHYLDHTPLGGSELDQLGIFEHQVTDFSPFCRQRPHSDTIAWTFENSRRGRLARRLPLENGTFHLDIRSTATKASPSQIPGLLESPASKTLGIWCTGKLTSESVRIRYTGLLSQVDLNLSRGSIHGMVRMGKCTYRVNKTGSRSFWKAFDQTADLSWEVDLIPQSPGLGSSAVQIRIFPRNPDCAPGIWMESIDLTGPAAGQ